MSNILIINSSLRHQREYLKKTNKLLMSFLSKNHHVTLLESISVDKEIFDNYDTIIFTYVVTMESVSSSLLQLFKRLGKVTNKKIYNIALCDEYEPTHCIHSSDVIKMWCQRNDLQYKGYLHIGSLFLIIKRPYSYIMANYIKKFVLHIHKNQISTLEVTLFSKTNFIKNGNKYWKKEIIKHRKKK